MEQKTLTLLTRTPLHVGAGSSVGIVDQPIMRERHTRFPIIPGSSLKGVLRDAFESADDNGDATWLFGPKVGATDDGKLHAGALLIGEARVLAFPVRSVRGGFAWLTCPLALRRYKRDTGAEYDVPNVAGEHCLAVEDLVVKNSSKAIFEDYCLECDGEAPDDVAAVLAKACADEVWGDVKSRLAVVSDEVFSHFAETACEVVNRVCIGDDGVVDNLFNQENVPSETLFYAAVGAQDGKGEANAGKAASEALDALTAKVKALGVLQVGGDETLGLGYCSIELT